LRTLLVFFYEIKLKKVLHSFFILLAANAWMKMTRFRPCIDLHSGQVKQIVGGTLDNHLTRLQTNFVSEHTAGYYAKLYKDKDLTGAHVIMLGPGNEEAAREALRTWPGGLQVGGGITDQNVKEWIDYGAEKVRDFWSGGRVNIS
jgi:phosphoribosylformimino-5-aminoimidazole carboxamide ribotide isomerase